MELIESSQFTRWIGKLKDVQGKARIVARINRLAEGLAGDVAPVGGGISELRIHSGPGYRVYFYQSGDALVILLCGGDKSTQSRDITQARDILNQWRREQ
ncbi:MAG: type II toxin-antitoxin system RelE/ParE family toxin [Parahaliea sp.]